MGLYAIMSTESAPLIQPTVYESHHLRVQVPERPLAPESMIVAKSHAHSFRDWTEADDRESFRLLQQIADYWKIAHVAEQYLIIGVDSGVEGEPPFRWEIVPYATTDSYFQRKWAQMAVMFKVFFGGAADTAQHVEDKQERYGEVFQVPYNYEPYDPVPSLHNDPFCTAEVLSRQKIIDGIAVNVLFNYRPMGVGGERLDFLITPKAHKNFNELTEDEYSEVMYYAKVLMRHFYETRQVRHIYLYTKYGRDAGVTVTNHVHWHLTVTTNRFQESIGFMLPPFQLSEEALRGRVTQLKNELQ